VRLTSLFAAVAVATTVVAVGCGSGAVTPTPRVLPTVAPTPRPPDVPPATRPPVLEVPAGIVELIEDEVSRLAGVPVDQLTLVRADQITWPDGSLGCPQPGEMYTQSLVEGYWIVVQANDETFDFRVAEDGSFHRCELPNLPSLPAGLPGATPN
jgi:hypothetical protein